MKNVSIRKYRNNLTFLKNSFLKGRKKNGHPLIQSPKTAVSQQLELDQVSARSWGLHWSLPCGWQGPTYLGHLWPIQVHLQEGGSEVAQLGLRPALWNGVWASKQGLTLRHPTHPPVPWTCSLTHEWPCCPRFYSLAQAERWEIIVVCWLFHFIVPTTYFSLKTSFHCWKSYIYFSAYKE